MKKINQVNNRKTLSSLEKQRCFSKKSFQGSSPRHPNPPYCTMSYEASQADRKMHYIYAKNTK